MGRKSKKDKIFEEVYKQYPFFKMEVGNDILPLSINNHITLKITTKLCVWVDISELNNELLAFAAEHAKEKFIKMLKTQKE